MRGHFSALIASATLFQAGCAPTEVTPPATTVAELGDPILEPAGVPQVVANVKSMDKGEVVKFVEEIRRTRPSQAEMDVWRAVANAAETADATRRIAVIELFDRFFRPGMELGELATVLDGAPWLRAENVLEVTMIGGRIPVTEVVGESIFEIFLHLPVSDHTTVYLRVQASPSAESLYEALAGMEPAAKEIVVSAMAIDLLDADEVELVSPAHRFPDSLRRN